jgi:uncharacterized protein with GYD domain
MNCGITDHDYKAFQQRNCATIGRLVGMKNDLKSVGSVLRNVTSAGHLAFTPSLKPRSSDMPLYMYQAAYTAESLATQLKKPENRVEAVGRAACEAVGGKLVGGWYCFGDYDLAIIADVPNNESMAAIALAIAAGGAIKSAKTTVLMTGAEAVAGMKKADAVARVYKPAR